MSCGLSACEAPCPRRVKAYEKRDSGASAFQSESGGHAASPLPLRNSNQP